MTKLSVTQSSTQQSTNQSKSITAHKAHLSQVGFFMAYQNKNT
ncbi:hypothetical protein CZ794_06975 [Psychrobacter sp. JB385]|nr:hypothetical protein CZ794_06975 [Psychrobacter sp. JB385]